MAEYSAQGLGRLQDRCVARQCSHIESHIGKNVPGSLPQVAGRIYLPIVIGLKWPFSRWPSSGGHSRLITIWPPPKAFTA